MPEFPYKNSMLTSILRITQYDITNETLMLSLGYLCIDKAVFSYFTSGHTWHSLSWKGVIIQSLSQQNVSQRFKFCSQWLNFAWGRMFEFYKKNGCTLNEKKNKKSSVFNIVICKNLSTRVSTGKVTQVQLKIILAGNRIATGVL